MSSDNSIIAEIYCPTHKTELLSNRKDHTIGGFAHRRTQRRKVQVKKDFEIIIAGVPHKHINSKT